MTEPTRVKRQMRARHESACAHCSVWVRQGEQIAQIDKGWVHLACVIALQNGSWKDTYAVPAEAARAKAAEQAVAWLKSHGQRVS